MWSLIWNINNQIKKDKIFFEKKNQAKDYADYYKQLLEIHCDLNHIQRRFGVIEKSVKFKLKIDYRLVKSTIQRESRK